MPASFLALVRSYHSVRQRKEEADMKQPHRTFIAAMLFAVSIAGLNAQQTQNPPQQMYGQPQQGQPILGVPPLSAPPNSVPHPPAPPKAQTPPCTPQQQQGAIDNHVHITSSNGVKNLLNRLNNRVGKSTQGVISGPTTNDLKANPAQKPCPAPAPPPTMPAQTK